MCYISRSGSPTEHGWIDVQSSKPKFLETFCQILIFYSTNCELKTVFNERLN